MAPAMTAESKLVYSAEVDNQPMAYVFANTASQGFMIVSADDVASPVLGYSDNSVIDPDNMPSNLKAWLDGYAREIAYATQHPSFNDTPVASAAEATDHAAVAPKLTTTWNQDAPYWNACPTLNGSRCYTGCVATAMAQVMNYHQWPEKGQGSISYSWNFNNQQTLKCDFSAITFEWDKMLDNYTSSSPADNCNAVAQLMMACGYASQMQYTPYASGTTGYSAATGMINYMNYDKSLAIQDRSWYSSAEWDNIVYTELTTNGPVYYDGTGSDGGHAFVCDGYRGNGYYHFNWGWGGLSDGYFLLNALNPGSQGAGGNTTGFNYSQSIMQNLSKPKAGSTVTAIIASEGGFTTSTTSTTKGRSVTFQTVVTGQGYGYFSFSVQPISNVSIGVKYVNTVTQAVGYMTSYSLSNISLDPLHGFAQIPVTIPSLIADGSYIISPVYKVGSGEWTDIKNQGSYNNAMTMTVSGTSVTFANVGAEAKIEASDVKLNNSITTSSGFNISLKLTNSGTREFNGQVEARLLNASGYVVNYGEPYTTILEPGESINVTYVSALVNGTLSADTYSLRFYSPTSKQYLNEPVSVTVFEEPQMTCSKFVIGNQNAINCNDVRARATVTCSTLGYTGPIAFIAYHVDDTSTPVGMFQTEPITFAAGESKSVTVSGIFQEGKVGESYIGTMAFLGQDGHYNQIGTATVRFRVSTASGIDDVTADRASDAAVIYPNPAESMATLEVPAAISSVDVYSLSGAMMKVNTDIDGNRASLDVSSLPSGTYIVIAACADGTRMPVKLIKR